MAQAAAVGIDVGGTKLVAFGVGPGGEVVDRRRLETPRGDPDRLVDVLAGVATEIGAGLPVGVGAAGAVSRDGAILYGPNLDVRDLPLAKLLADRLEVAVTVRNDANVALYGEVRAGVARGARDVVMITLGTGVGGAILADGRLVEGANGLAGELGHVTVVDGGRRCPCGNRGCLEAYSSGSAIGLAAREVLGGAGEPASSLREVDLVDGKAVTEAALAGDELALDVVRQAGYWLGVGLIGICNALDPELVVVGGGAATLAGPLVVPEAVNVLSTRLLGAAHRPLPRVVTAKLGDDAGAIGAALLARDERGG